MSLGISFWHRGCFFFISYSSISVPSISKFDERCCFLYVHDNSDDFQIYFSTEEQCGR